MLKGEISLFFFLPHFNILGVCSTWQLAPTLLSKGHRMSQRTEASLFRWKKRASVPLYALVKSTTSHNNLCVAKQAKRIAHADLLLRFCSPAVSASFGYWKKSLWSRVRHSVDYLFLVPSTEPGVWQWSSRRKCTIALLWSIEPSEAPDAACEK